MHLSSDNEGALRGLQYREDTVLRPGVASWKTKWERHGAAKPERRLLH